MAEPTTDNVSPTFDVFVGLGSNLGDREGSLQAAIRQLREQEGIEVLRESSLIETAPVDSPDGAGMFLNGVVWLRTALPAHSVLGVLLDIERALGRDRADQPRNAPRTIDLDLLLYGQEQIDEPDLEVPHPRMHEREFVLWPLLQIASTLKDPKTGEPYATAYARLKEERSPASS